MTATTNERPVVIIKRRRKHAEHAHHGGAWKVAYADFVTAMMAFFLLLWLLNVTTDEQKQGIADYFDPTNVARGTSGAGGVLGGRSASAPGNMTSPSSRFSLTVAMPGLPEPLSDSDALAEGVTEEWHDAAELGPGNTQLAYQTGAIGRGAGETDRPAQTASDTGAVTNQQIEQALREREQAQFAQATEELRQAIQSVPDLRDLAPNLIVDQTPEGLRIQIVDQDGRSMFPSGGVEPYPRTRQLLGLIAEVVAKLPNKVSIRGHTDSAPFANRSGYDNWDLSTDRANASRRTMEAAGLPANRIAFVVGKADTDPLDAQDPTNPLNRRISIVVLRVVPPANPAGVEPTGAEGR